MKIRGTITPVTEWGSSVVTHYDLELETVPEEGDDVEVEIEGAADKVSIKVGW